jgi:hypothetical protein
MFPRSFPNDFLFDACMLKGIIRKPFTAFEIFYSSPIRNEADRKNESWLYSLGAC